MLYTGHNKRRFNVKNIINGFLTAISMYSIIPVKAIEWKNNTTKYMLCFLPLIGIIIAVFSAVWLIIAKFFNINALLYSAVALIIPILISGGTHTDGFIDMADAFFSYTNKKQRLVIMKDSHVGAFGVISFACILLLQLGLYSEIYIKEKYIIMLVSFVISRTFASISVISFKCAKNEGLGKLFEKSSNKYIVFIFSIIYFIMIFVLLAYFFSFVFFLYIIFTMLIWLYAYNCFCSINFGGVTGDTAGAFIVISETLLLAVCVIAV